ncbi:MAG: sensor domain-containing diguanylate cyclase [Candidatus Aminicenantes bacterium]|nr:sensor domain-containing diguanylate cyclase [Candidatus Aminicenantes bacterium]
MEKAKHIKLIHKIGEEIENVFDFDKTLNIIVDTTKELLELGNCAIFLLEDKELILKALSEFPETDLGITISVGQGVVGLCAERKEAVNIGDVTKFEGYIPSGLKNVKSELAVPIIREGRLLGVITTESLIKNNFTIEHEKTLKILSSFIALQINNLKITKERFRDLDLLQQIGLNIAGQVHMEKLFDTIVNLVTEHLSFDSLGIFLRENNSLILKSVSNLPDKKGLKIPFGRGVVGLCAKNKKTLNIPDVSKINYYIPSGIKDVKSCLAIPIFFKDEIIGVLGSESTKLNAYTEHNIKLIKILSYQMGIAIRNAKIMTELEKLSVTDPLTGLYNYRYFRKRLEEEVARSKRYKRDLSLFLLDIDNFKQINDRFGHLKGDKILVLLADILKQNTRRSDCKAVKKQTDIDISARYGGEEFVVILPETPAKGAEVAAMRISEIFKEKSKNMIKKFSNNKDAYPITSSIGISTLDKEDSGEDLIRKADNAMYKSKSEGKDSIYIG